MLKKIATAAALTLAATGVYADNKVGVFFVPDAELEVDGGSDDGDGFGLYGQFDVSPTNFIYAEYSAVELDDSEIEIDQIRVGFGGHIALSNPQLAVMLSGELINLELEVPGFGSDDETGFGAHAGLVFAASPQVDLYAQLGFVSIDDLDGPEFKVGGNFQVNSQFSLFADYRSSQLDDDGDDFELSDLRLGGAVHF